MLRRINILLTQQKYLLVAVYGREGMPLGIRVDWENDTFVPRPFARCCSDTLSAERLVGLYDTFQAAEHNRVSQEETQLQRNQEVEEQYREFFSKRHKLQQRRANVVEEGIQQRLDAEIAAMEGHLWDAAAGFAEEEQPRRYDIVEIPLNQREPQCVVHLGKELKGPFVYHGGHEGRGRNNFVKHATKPLLEHMHAGAPP
eukprot:TRINITY_DN59871_c1_g1_i1.p1 TRINITY_DN59871_c1_g1~~TRINITY_DN59871_c1_g1_i1.p1  ORF type:complete len:200 (+),score=31.19 TRINITY_DN59871_c1_g1_i1:29-628(+)